MYTYIYTYIKHTQTRCSLWLSWNTNHAADQFVRASRKEIRTPHQSSYSVEFRTRVGFPEMTVICSKKVSEASSVRSSFIRQ